MRKSGTATITDVAVAAGVSRAAVSKVIRDANGVSPQMRAKVLAAIDDLGYRPLTAARAMRGATFTIGVELPAISNPFFHRIVDGATQALRGTPYQLILAPTGVGPDDGSEALDVLADRQVDGLVAIASRVAPERLEQLGARVPLVVLGRHDFPQHYDTVVGDDLAGARLAVQHLADLGHRRIVHVTLEQQAATPVPGTPHAMRAVGYRKALRDLGRAGQAEILWVPPEPDGVLAAARAFLAGVSEPVGLFVAHDQMALPVLQAIDELGRSAGQVSVVGYDDIAIAAHSRLSLTTVHQPGAEMGELAVRLLLERIRGRTEVRHQIIPPRLVVRGSTAPPTRRAYDP